MMETSSSNSSANLSPEPAKLFVGGIDGSLKKEEIMDYFVKFGEVKEVVLVKDKTTGNVRGFGFVEFLDPDSAEKALNEKEHAIGERKVEVKRARPRGERRRNYQFPQYNNVANNYGNNENPTRSKKIFVGGLSSSITEDEFRSYFEKFGRITDVVIMYDSSTHRPRGFGFITFDSVEAVDCVLQEKFHQLSNKIVEVKIAVPKDSENQNNISDSNGSVGGGREPAFSNHQRGYYSPYSPGYGLYPSYVPSPVPGFYYGTTGYGGIYGVGPYGGVSYGAPYVARSPWNGPPGMVGVRRSPVYSGYNVGFGPFGGYAGMISGGCSPNDKLNQTDNDVRITDHSTGAEDVGSEQVS